MTILAIDPGPTEKRAKQAVRMRDWRAKHPGYDKRPFRNTEAWKKAKKRYRESDKGKQTDNLRQRKQRIEAPDKPRSRDAVKYAKKTGRLVPSFYCRECGKIGNLHAHHPDHKKQLAVVWLCPQCHSAIHNGK